MEWDEFYDPMGFFKLMAKLQTNDYRAIRYLVRTHTLSEYEEAYRELLN